jgi:hypothetical protein
MVRLVNSKGAEKLLPKTILLKRIISNIQLPYQVMSGGGAVKTGKPTKQPKQFALEGRIYFPDKELIEQEYDALLEFLQYTPIEVYRDHTQIRFLKSYPLGAQEDWIDLGEELDLQIPMIALDPYWYGQEVTTLIEDTQTIAVEGTEPTYPWITVMEPTASLNLTNALSGRTLQITLDNPGYIAIDCANFTVWINDVSRLDAVNDDFKLNGFYLLPGEQQITTNVDITLLYRPRWY